MTAHRTTPDERGSSLRFKPTGIVEEGPRGGVRAIITFERITEDDRIKGAQAVAGDEYVVVKRDDLPPVEVAWSGTGGNCLQVTIDGSVWVSTPDEGVEWLEREVRAYTALLNARRAEAAEGS